MMQDDITYFNVDEYGTISYAEFYEFKTRDDAYDLSLEYDVATPADLISFAEYCPPLQWLVGEHYTEYREDPVCPDRLINMPEEPEDGWIDWVLGIDKKTFSSLRSGIKEWLSKEPHWREYDYIHYTKWSHGAAFAFFEDEPDDTRDALGISLIEGPYPGNDYRGAKLRISIEEANAIAKVKSLSYRFRKEKEE